MKEKYWILLILLKFLFSEACDSPSQVSNYPPRVTAVFPSSDTLPENLLRLYIQFSTPMKTVGNLERIKLLNDSGHEVQGAIFNNVYELWDKEQKQLTLLFDPGRVKTGLEAHEAMGRALEPGKDYQIVVGNLEDVNHQKLTKPFIKSFHIIAADTVAPNLKRWALELPPAGSVIPLHINFPGILDQLSLHHRLVITNAKDEIIEGTIQLGEYEKRWSFVPKDPWQKGDYHLYVNARLEDPAGNNLNGLFDHQAGSLNRDREGETLRLDFEIKQ